MLSFASATGNLFNRLGKIGGVISTLDAYQTTQLSNITDTTNGIVAQFDSESDIQAIAGSSYIGQLNAAGSIGSFCQQMAVATLNRMIFRDNPLQGLTLTSQNTPSCLRELIIQMQTAGATVLAMTVTGTGSAFTSPPNVGNGVVVVSVRRPGDGRILENAFAEMATITCTVDSYTGGATAGNETLLIQGQSQQISYFAFDWPLGSGASISVNAIDGRQSNSSGNILTNSGFEDWTNNVPDNFTLTVGAGGVNINQETSIVYDAPPNTGMRMTGDSSGTLTSFQQSFNSSSGTSGTLTALSQYAFNIFMRGDSSPLSQGQLVVELIDGNGVVIQDIAGTPNQFTFDLTTLNTIFTSFTGVFRTPRAMPSSYSIRFRLAVALQDGRSIYLDRSGLGLMSQLYTSGPYFAVFSGSNDFVRSDSTTATITNSRGPAGTLNTWQTCMARQFPQMISMGFLLPSSSVPSISDNLIS